jgi:N-acetylglucosaminyldiphosphoundecaprenol N-acetyl-beta-D-mannosaminyltransferase
MPAAAPPPPPLGRPPWGREIALLGRIPVAPLDLRAATDVIAARDPAAPFAFVATINAQILLLAEEAGNGLRAAHDAAWLRLNDSTILARLHQRALGEAVPVAAGSDLCVTLLNGVIRRDDKITVIGGGPALLPALRERFRLRGLVQHEPPMGYIDRPEARDAAIRFIEAHPARFTFVATGAPRSERLMALVAARGHTARPGLDARARAGMAASRGDRAAPAGPALCAGPAAAAAPGAACPAGAGRGAAPLIARLLRRGSRFILAFADQGLTALLSLGITLWLIRRGSAEQLAAYVFWANAALVAGTAIAALTTVHLYRLPPAPSAGRRPTERAVFAALLLLCGLAALLAAAAVPWLGPTLGLWMAVPFIPGTVIGLHARALAATHGAMALAAAISAAACLLVFGAIGAEALLGAAPSVPLLLGLNGLCQGLAGLLVIRRLGGARPAGFGAGARRRWRVLARRSGWSLLAGLGNETFTRLYIFAVPVWFGPAALAGLAAAQTMLRPATLLAGAFGAAARGPLAARRHAGDARGFWRLVLLGAAGPAAVTLALGGLLALGWPWVSAWLFAGRYAGLVPEVLCWAGVMAISCFWVTGLAGLQTLGRLRDLARAELAAAGVSALAMPGLLGLLGPVGALVAIMLGGLVQVALLGRGVARGLRALRR